jgi:hypothetical protein
VATEAPVTLNPGVGGAVVRAPARPTGGQQVVTMADSTGALDGPPLLLGVPLLNPCTALGDTLVYTPAAGKAIRLTWLYLSTPDTNTAGVLARVRFSSQSVAQSFYSPWLSNPGVFSHRCKRVGAINDSLIVALSAPQPAYVSFDIEEI